MGRVLDGYGGLVVYDSTVAMVAWWSIFTKRGSSLHDFEFNTVVGSRFLDPGLPDIYCSVYRQGSMVEVGIQRLRHFRTVIWRRCFGDHIRGMDNQE